MTIGPIFVRDLRPERPGSRLRWDRLVAGGMAGLVLLVLAALDRWVDGVSLVRLLKSVPFSAIAPYFLLMIGLSLGVKLLSSERREGTLPLLLLTCLTGHDLLLGKLLAALVIELNTFLATVPALVLPLLLSGLKWKEICLLSLGCANVVFFGLALGLFAVVFLEEEKAVSLCLILVLPFLALATPFGMFLPSGFLRDTLACLQHVNPGEALAHVTLVAGGFRSSEYWMPLLLSHLVAWGLLGLGGKYLAGACRWKASRSAKAPQRRWPRWIRENRSSAVRARMLDRNPFLWLASRHRWATIQVWLYLVLSAVLWSWLAWVSYALRALPITIVFAIAMASSWLVQFLVTVPSEASRCLVEDRQSGALEMLLCTPLPVDQILRGQWVALGRRYWAPLSVAIFLSLGLMIAGYVTDGFGGMLDAQDRSLWLFVWLSAIGLWPLALITACWVAMRRTLIVRQAGDASAVAVLQVVLLPCIAMAVASMLLHSLFQWNPDWLWGGTLFVGGLAAAQLGLAWRARTILLRDLRQAAMSRSLAPASLDGGRKTLRRPFGRLLRLKSAV